MSTTLDQRVRALCGAVFAEPGRLVHVAQHHVDGAISYPPHGHAGWAQLDVAAGCAGYWRVGGRRVAAEAVTAVVLPAGLEHGYELRPGAAGPGFFATLKLRVDRGELPPWPRVARAVAGSAPLLSAFRRLHTLWVAPQRRPALLAAAGSQVLCLWPGGDPEPSSTAAPSTRGIDPRLERALELIDRSLAPACGSAPPPPPTPDALARAACLSTRQLSRRFRAVFGCSVTQYLAHRRAAHARELLTGGRHTASQAADLLGFSSLAAFSRWFHRTTGVTASAAMRDAEAF